MSWVRVPLPAPFKCCSFLLLSGYFMFDLTGRTALITGGSGAIGFACAQGIAEHGAHVILTGTNVERLSSNTESILSKNCSASYIACDLSNQSEIESMMSEVDVDILVCNAGITDDKLLLRMSVESMTKVLNINLISNFLLIKLAARKMLKNSWGRIIGISSVVGSSGNPGQANYCASKAGMTGMIKSVAHEFAARGITANCIAPGFIESDMTSKLLGEHSSKILERIPMNRFGLGSDVAGAAVFLASNHSSYITGQTIHINGGMLMV